jgi:hypothetical protein
MIFFLNETCADHPLEMETNLPDLEFRILGSIPWHGNSLTFR